jgi:DNA polymerase III subunit delta'
MPFDRVVGHARALRVLSRALASGRVPQAYLFWGPDGVGKELVARETARVLLCPAAEAPAACGACASCRKVEAGEHPDLHLLAAKGASISVQEIRSLQETLGYRAFERGRKVAILRDAFRLTREAGNALLKTLEEPPADTHVFLLAHHRSQLLPTLVSRCQAVRFDPLSAAEVRQFLGTRGVGGAAAEQLAELAGGSPGQALQGDPGVLASLEKDVADAAAALAGLKASERFALSERWSKEKERLGVRLDRVELLLRRRAREAAERGQADAKALASLSGVFRTRRLLEQNVNPQLALDCFFLGLFEADGEEIS